MQVRHPPTKEADTLSGFGNWNSSKALAQVHGCLVVRGGAPVGQTVSIRVASLDEVSPITGHNGLNLVVGFIPADARVV